MQWLRARVCAGPAGSVGCVARRRSLTLVRDVLSTGRSLRSKQAASRLPLTDLSSSLFKQAAAAAATAVTPATPATTAGGTHAPTPAPTPATPLTEAVVEGID